MGLKLEQTCSRCNRNSDIEIASSAEAMKVETNFAARETKTVEIEKYLNAVPTELMPDLIVFIKGQGFIHTVLCEREDGRSCLSRIEDLAKQMAQLEERKPRSKKSKNEVVEIVSAPPTKLAKSA